MNRARHNQPWGARPPAKGPVKPGSQRPEWVRAISEGMALATAGSTPLAAKLPHLKEAVRGLAAEGFPVEAGNSARLMAESFLKAADALEIATGERRREAFARAIKAVAEALDAALTDVRTSEADAVRARYGERD